MSAPGSKRRQEEIDDLKMEKDIFEWEMDVALEQILGLDTN
jgi:hypothetical protein